MNLPFFNLIRNELNYAIKSFSALGSYPVFLLVMIFLFKIEYNFEALRLLICFILIYLLGLPIRSNFFKHRKNPKHHAEIYENTSVITYSSFPSFHATRITILSLLIFTIFNYSIDSVILMLIVLYLVCYSRILLQKHYLNDIYGGISFGLLIWGMSWLIVGVLM